MENNTKACVMNKIVKTVTLLLLIATSLHSEPYKFKKKYCEENYWELYWKAIEALGNNDEQQSQVLTTKRVRYLMWDMGHVDDWTKKDFFHVIKRNKTRNIIFHLETFVDPLITNEEGKTAFACIMESGNAAAIVKLCQLEAYNHHGESAFECAVASGNIAAVIGILIAKIDPNTRSRDGKTPLMVAPSVAIADLLLQHGADPNAEDDLGKTPLDYAAEYNRIAVAQRLLECPTVNVNSCSTTTDKGALDLAIENGHGEMVQLLLQHKVAVDNYDVEQAQARRKFSYEKAIRGGEDNGIDWAQRQNDYAAIAEHLAKAIQERKHRRMPRSIYDCLATSRFWFKHFRGK